MRKLSENTSSINKNPKFKIYQQANGEIDIFVANFSKRYNCFLRFLDSSTKKGSDVWELEISKKIKTGNSMWETESILFHKIFTVKWAAIDNIVNKKQYYQDVKTSGENIVKKLTVSDIL